jgi:cytochrome oxidase Cu insertion factor (SCO1/SenC/PrrC family)
MQTFRNPWWILIILLLIFGIPMFGAWYVWKNPDLLPMHRTNRGELIQPAININQLKIITGHHSQQFSALNGKWTLLYVTGQNCELACQKTIYNLRQIQTATGKNQDRVQRVFLTLAKKANATVLEKLAREHPNMILAQAKQADWAEVSANLPTQNLAISQAYLYLVDPKGFMVLGYRPEANPSNVLKDLEKLLKVSQIG